MVARRKTRTRQPRQPVITTYDIAKRAGVNQSTVSRALSRPDKIRPDTIERVMRACEELGYVPNIAARTLKTGQSFALAVYIPFGTETVFADPFVPVFLGGVNEEASQAGYSTLLFYPGSAKTKVDLVQLVKSRRADGVILTSPSEPDPRLEALAKAKVPCVTGRYPTKRGSSVICVDVDNRHTGALAARFLLSRGHRRIGLLLEPPRSRVGVDFQAGFCETMAEAGVKQSSRLVKHIPITFEAAREAARQLLAAKTPPSALVAATALAVFPLVEAVRQAGLDVLPLGVDSPLFRFLRPDLPRIKVPTRELGRRMTAALIHAVQNSGAKEPVEMLRAELLDENGLPFTD